MDKNKLIWIIIGAVVILNVGLLFGGKILVDKVADKVIEKLQKDYSPSPYGPGFDPDKVNPDAFKGPKKYFEMRQKSQMRSELQPLDAKVLTVAMNTADAWRSDWEQERDPLSHLQ